MVITDLYTRYIKDTIQKEGLNMGRQVTAILYVMLMVAIIIAVDLLFFRHRFWERLLANIGIVLVFVAFYMRFLKHP